MAQRLIPADVALFLPAFTFGGVERMRLNLADGFLNAGYSVELVALDAQGPLRDEVPEGVRVIDLGGGRMLSALPRLVRYFRQNRPRTFLSALDYANLVSLWAHRLARVDTRIYVGTHKILSVATDDSEHWRERHIMPRLLRRAYPHADGIIAVSDGIAEDLVNYLGLSAERVTMINNPALSDEVLSRSHESANHPWMDVPGQASHTILSVGRLHREKDFPNLLQAFGIACNRYPELRLIIVGEGEERPALEAKVKQMGLDHNVDMPGFRKNPWAFMRRASVFVSSSLWEGFGNVHVEALGCGCPVVSTNSPGPAEILHNGRFGRLVPRSDYLALADAIIEVLEAPRESERLVGRAMEFHINKVIKNYCRLMRL